MNAHWIIDFFQATDEQEQKTLLEKLEELKDFKEVTKIFSMEQINQLLPSIFRLLTDVEQQPDVRRAAADSLATFGSLSVPYILEGLQHEDYATRCLALGPAFSVADKSFAKVLLTFLDEDYVRIPIRALATLARIGDKEFLPFILPYLENENSNIRDVAVWAVATLGGPEVLGYILKRVEDATVVRQTVAYVLRNFVAEESKQALLRLLSDPDMHLRVLTIESLGSFRDEEVVAKLLDLTVDKDVYIRIKAIEALSKAGSAVVIPFLERLEQTDTGKTILGETIQETSRKAINQILSRGN